MIELEIDVDKPGYCDACQTGGHVYIVIVGDEPAWESSTARLCRECAVKAADLINRAIDVPAVSDVL